MANTMQPEAGQRPSVLIYGAGAIGGYLAAKLATYYSPEQITLIDADEAHVTHIKTHGLQVNFKPGQPPQTFKNFKALLPQQLNENDLKQYSHIIVATKCAISEKIVSDIPEGIPLLIVQNGIHQSLHHRVKNHALFAAADLAGVKQSAGHIQCTSSGGISFGCIDSQNDELVSTFVKLLSPVTQLQWKHIKNFQGYMWSKLILNSALNPLSALNDMTYAELFKNKKTSKQLVALLREGSMLARHCHIKLERVKGILPHQLAAILNIPVLGRLIVRGPHTYSSMHEDMKQGRPTEIDFLNGYLIKKAQQAGITATNNQAVYNQITEYSVT